MLAPTKFLTIGLKILVLIHTTQSFVLLTANIDDVKKLAMKFVSESLADKIAKFVGQAAQHVINQVSEEVHRDVSEENKKFYTKQASSDYEHDKFEDEAKKVTAFKDSRKEIFNRFEVASKYGPPPKQPVQYAYPLDPGKRPKNQYATEDKNQRTEDRAQKEEDRGNKGLLDDNQNNAESEVKQMEDNILSEDKPNYGFNFDDANGGSLEKFSGIFRSSNSTDDQPNLNKREDLSNGQMIATSGNIILTRQTTDDGSDKKGDSN